MNDLLYSAMDIAAILSVLDISCKKENEILDDIWKGETAYLEEQYRNDKKRFIFDVMYWMHYFYDKPVLDEEFSVICRDMEHLGHEIETRYFTGEFSKFDLFFKSVRLRILYINTKNFYIRIKMRTLLKSYGYKRRSQNLVLHMKRCMEFYHLEATLRGGVPCSVADVDIDDMLTINIYK